MWKKGKPIYSLLLIVVLAVFLIMLAILAPRMARVKPMYRSTGGELSESLAAFAPSPSQDASRGKFLFTEEKGYNKEPATERKIIKSGTLFLEVDDYAKKEKIISEIANSFGGFIFSSTINKTEEGSISGTIIVKVPEDKFDKVILEIEKIGKLKTKEITGSDVTEEFIDLEARLKNSRAERDRIMEIFKKSGKITEILEVEKELARVQGEIEGTTGRLRYLTERTRLATITVDLYEKGAVSFTTAVEWRYGRVVKEIFKALLITLRKVVIFITAVVIFGLIWVPLLFLGRFLKKRVGKTRSG